MAIPPPAGQEKVNTDEGNVLESQVLSRRADVLAVAMTAIVPVLLTLINAINDNAGEKRTFCPRQQSVIPRRIELE